MTDIRNVVAMSFIVLGLITTSVILFSIYALLMFLIPGAVFILYLLIFGLCIKLVYFLFVTVILRGGIPGAVYERNIMTSAPFRIVKFTDEGIKISGVKVNIEINKEEIRGVVIERSNLVGFRHQLYFEKEGVLNCVIFNTFLKKYTDIDDSKILIIPGIMPLTTRRAMELVEINPRIITIFTWAGKSSPLKRKLEFYLGKWSMDDKGIKKIMEGTGGGIMADLKYLNELKYKLENKNSLLQLDFSDFYKLPFMFNVTMPFSKLGISESGNIYYSFSGYTYYLKKSDIRKVIIENKSTLGHHSINLLHNDIDFVERVTFFGSGNVVNFLKNNYDNVLLED